MAQIAARGRTDDARGQAGQIEPGQVDRPQGSSRAARDRDSQRMTNMASLFFYGPPARNLIPAGIISTRIRDALHEPGMTG